MSVSAQGTNAHWPELQREEGWIQQKIWDSLLKVCSMTQQFVKSAQERLATWNWCKNSASFNKSRANQNHVTKAVSFRLLLHCVAIFWNFQEQSSDPQDRAICANQKYPLLWTQWILCTYTQTIPPSQAEGCLNIHTYAGNHTQTQQSVCVY